MHIPDANDPYAYELLSEDDQRFLLHWISENLRPIQRFNPKRRSYEIKHWIEEEYPDRYFTNGEFKGAMVTAGYKVQDPNADNWVFNVSEESPYLAKKKAQI